MAALSANSRLLRPLISSRFGNIDGLVVEWETRVADGTQRVGSPRNRGTIYRWLNSGLPSNRDDILGFASALDIDPICLVEIDDDFIRLHYPRERRLFLLGALDRSKLAPFWQLYTPGPHWPDKSLTHNFFNRSWISREFSQNGAKDGSGYARLNIGLSDDRGTVFPQVFHFAYRRLGARDGMWRPYGSVICAQGQGKLVSENGDLKTRNVFSRLPNVSVETFFGPGPAEFRITSLHDFSLRVQFPAVGIADLRFEA